MKFPTLNVLDEIEDFYDEEESSFGSLSTSAGMLPLKALSVECDITGMFHRTRVRQVFGNSHDQPLEATYIFPLPARVGVCACRMEVNGRVIEGKLKERQAAREAYDQAIAKGHRAAIAEEERPEVFTMRFGNLMPGEEATVELELIGALSWDENETSYRFPLVVAPRYIPGRPLNLLPAGDGAALDTDLTPDASRISPPTLLPGFPNPVQLDIAVTFDAAGLEIYDPRTSMPCDLEEDPDSDRITLRLAHQERLNRDFILRFKLGHSDDAITDLALAPDRDGSYGTYCLTVVPPPMELVSPRDVVIVLDRSGSMGGWKMTAARRAAARLIDSLDSVDRFRVVAFDNQLDGFPSRQALLPATDYNRFRATEFLARIDSRGGTEMAEPLKAAMKNLRVRNADDRQRAIVLITDGQVGNEDHLLRVLEKERGDARIYTVGIDRAVNGGFLERLADLGSGFSELVESENRLEDVLDRIRRRLGIPAFQNARLSVNHGKVDNVTQAPARLGDAFPERPWCVLGRYKVKGADKLELVVRAYDADGNKFSMTAKGREVEAPFLAATWARAHLRDLEDRYAAGAANRPALEKMIVSVSLRYQVLCRFTAWLAVDRAEVVNKGGQVVEKIQPVEAPAGWGVEVRELEEGMHRMDSSAEFSFRAKQTVRLQMPPAAAEPTIGFSCSRPPAAASTDSTPSAVSLPAKKAPKPRMSRNSGKGKRRNQSGLFRSLLNAFGFGGDDGAIEIPGAEKLPAELRLLSLSSTEVSDLLQEALDRNPALELDKSSRPLDARGEDRAAEFYVTADGGADVVPAAQNPVPRIRIRDVYQSSDDEAGSLRAKDLTRILEDARSLLRKLQKREEILLQIVAAIVKHQIEYLRKSTNRRKTMSSDDIRNATGLDKGIIEFALQGIYLDSLQGVHELVFFTTRTARPIATPAGAGGKREFWK